MVCYSDIRADMRDGDVLGVKARGLVAWTIRGLTGESLNHVAMLVWIDDGLWVGEMREGVGYRLVPASQWMAERADDLVFWIQAPEPVSGSRAVHDYVLRTRVESPRYSYLTLISVWWSQVRNIRTPGRLVCSTWAQRGWMSAGYRRFRRLADPGDFFEHGRATIPIQA